MSGIYVHIPFCHSKCAYCDFFSMPGIHKATTLVGGIVEEYRLRRAELGHTSVRTIYFGGGTPSCLPVDLLKTICDILPMHNAVERTIEVNPEDVSLQAAEAWSRLGFNRVSMGVQSLVDNELQAVGRRHTAAGALAAIEVLRAAGLDNISCDLIYGLPGQTLESWTESLCTLLATGIPHLSAYSLGYEPGTRLTAMLQAGKITPVDDDVAAGMYHILCSEARRAGMDHYEISNFGRPELHSVHNSSYWDGTPYLGLGPAAHSLDVNGIRRAAAPNIATWLDTGAQVERESREDAINDTIITALRTSDGLSLDSLPPDIVPRIEAQAAPYLHHGRLVRNGGKLVIPEEHWLVSDAIMRDLLI